jgi:uncharacterized protein (TIGR03435 family)
MAIREQLGLRVVPAKGPVEVIVIDHIDQPSRIECVAAVVYL